VCHLRDKIADKVRLAGAGWPVEEQRVDRSTRTAAADAIEHALDSLPRGTVLGQQDPAVTGLHFLALPSLRFHSTGQFLPRHCTEKSLAPQA
jgi:hypothetical protein